MNRGLLRGFSRRPPDSLVAGDFATTYSTSSTTFVDVGALYSQNVVAPDSGCVLLLGSLDVSNPNGASNADVVIGAQVDSNPEVYIGGHAFNGTSDGGARINIPLLYVFTDLVPGRTHEVSLRWRVTSGTTGLDGSTRGGVEHGSRMLLIPLP